MTSDERWLTAVWPFVRDHLAQPPTSVLEIGCGPLGGFVPMLRSVGHDAVGVDPEAPDGIGYEQTTFEQYTPPADVDVVVACLSLHHVSSLDDVIDRMAAVLKPFGTVVVVEWAWELCDEATARWCFQRLPTADADSGPSWLHRRQDAWIESGAPWEAYLRGWAAEDGMHPGETVLRRLQSRFRPVALDRGPYFFPDLDGVTEGDERAAIEAGLVRATQIRFVGRSTR